MKRLRTQIGVEQIRLNRSQRYPGQKVKRRYGSGTVQIVISTDRNWQQRRQSKRENSFKTVFCASSINSSICWSSSYLDLTFFSQKISVQKKDNWRIIFCSCYRECLFGDSSDLERKKTHNDAVEEQITLTAVPSKIPPKRTPLLKARTIVAASIQKAFAANQAKKNAANCDTSPSDWK